jgi:hypothetical protein
MSATNERLFQLCVYVPDTDVDPVKEALFAAGAGRLGAYDCCCWQTRGTGQFRPLAGSTPHIGRLGAVGSVPETKLELIISEPCLAAVLDALIQSHPYETPAYSYWRINEP